MSFAERLKAIRKKKGITQRELADLLGIPYQGISQYERGIRQPKYQTIERLSKALGCDVSELIEPFAIETIEQKAQYLAKAFPLSDDFKEDIVAYRDDVFGDMLDGEFYDTFMAAKEKSECVLLEETKSVSDAQIQKELCDLFSQINRKGKVLIYKYAFELSISGEYDRETEED